MNYTDTELDILKRNYHLGIDHCLSLLPARNRSGLITKASKMGLRVDVRKSPSLPPRVERLPVINRIIQRRRYKGQSDPLVSKDFSMLTDMSNPYSVYLLGLFWADGYMNPNGSNIINIKIASRDELELDNLFDNLCVWNKYIRRRKPDQLNWYESVEYSLCNSFYKEFLVKNNYLNKSGGSPDAILSKIPDDYKHYWYLGYFDGDGSCQSKGYTVEFASCYNQDWRFLETIMRNLDVKYNIRQAVSKKGHKSSSVVINRSSNCLKFLNFIYQNKIGNLGFDRKYSCFGCLQDRLKNKI